jgi:hypothetical protein
VRRVHKVRQHARVAARVAQALLAGLEQAGTLFKARQQIGEGDIAGLHRLDDGLQPLQGSFEGKGGGIDGVHGKTVGRAEVLSTPV